MEQLREEECFGRFYLQGVEVSDKEDTKLKESFTMKDLARMGLHDEFRTLFLNSFKFNKSVDGDRVLRSKVMLRPQWPPSRPPKHLEVN